MRKMLLCGIGVGAIALGLVLVACQIVSAGSKVQVGSPCAEPNRPSLAEVDHSAFDALLQKYVNDTAQVGYAQWKANAADLQALDGS